MLTGDRLIVILVGPSGLGRSRSAWGGIQSWSRWSARAGFPPLSLVGGIQRDERRKNEEKKAMF